MATQTSLSTSAENYLTSQATSQHVIAPLHAPQSPTPSRLLGEMARSRDTPVNQTICSVPLARETQRSPSAVEPIHLRSLPPWGQSQGTGRHTVQRCRELFRRTSTSVPHRSTRAVNTFHRPCCSPISSEGVVPTNVSIKQKRAT